MFAFQRKILKIYSNFVPCENILEKKTGLKLWSDFRFLQKLNFFLRRKYEGRHFLLAIYEKSSVCVSRLYKLEFYQRLFSKTLDEGSIFEEDLLIFIFEREKFLTL